MDKTFWMTRRALEGKIYPVRPRLTGYVCSYYTFITEPFCALSVQVRVPRKEHLHPQ
jgi:hypothetical protein